MPGGRPLWCGLPRLFATVAFVWSLNPALAARKDEGLKGVLQGTQSRVPKCPPASEIHPCRCEVMSKGKLIIIKVLVCKKVLSRSMIPIRLLTILNLLKINKCNK